MIIKFNYTTNEGGIWREAFTDVEHEGRILSFLSSLAVPLPTRMTVVTASMAGLAEPIIIHSFRSHHGVEWDAIKGIRSDKSKTSLNSAYDEVWKDDNR